MCRTRAWVLVWRALVIAHEWTVARQRGWRRVRVPQVLVMAAPATPSPSRQLVPLEAAYAPRPATVVFWLLLTPSLWAGQACTDPSPSSGHTESKDAEKPPGTCPHAPSDERPK